MLQQPRMWICRGTRTAEDGEMAAAKTRKLLKAGTEEVEIGRSQSRRRASNRARRCYVGARRTRTGRRWLLACLTTCLLMVLMGDVDADGRLSADMINGQTGAKEGLSASGHALAAPIRGYQLRLSDGKLVVGRGSRISTVHSELGVALDGPLVGWLA